MPLAVQDICRADAASLGVDAHIETPYVGTAIAKCMRSAYRSRSRVGTCDIEWSRGYSILDGAGDGVGALVLSAGAGEPGDVEDVGEV